MRHAARAALRAVVGSVAGGFLFVGCTCPQGRGDASPIPPPTASSHPATASPAALTGAALQLVRERLRAFDGPDGPHEPFRTPGIVHTADAEVGYDRYLLVGTRFGGDTTFEQFIAALREARGAYVAIEGSDEHPNKILVLCDLQRIVIAPQVW